MEYKITSYYTNVDGNSIMIIAAICDSEIIGSCGIFLDNDCAWLRELFIAENHRRKGIAKAIVQHAIEVCKSNGKYSMAMSVKKDNKAALILYNSLGFTITHDYEKPDNQYMMTMPFPKNVMFLTKKS